MIKYDFEQFSSAWNDIRIGRITGTRFKTLMQKDSTQGYKDLITDIACEIITGKKEEKYTNDIMQRGIDMEPYAVKEYESIFDVEMEEIGFITPNEDSKYYEWIGISPDRLKLEVKCPLAKTHLNYIKNNVLPNEYKYQVQSQLFVTKCEYWDFMSYYPEMKPFIIRVLPDHEIHEMFEYELDKIIPLIKKEIEIYKNYNLI